MSTLLDQYRSAYILEQEEPEMELEDTLDPAYDEEEGLWDDWPEDDLEYYDSLCKEFTFLMENNL